MLPPQLRSDHAGGFGNPGRATARPGRRQQPNEDRAEFSAELDMQQEMQDVFNAANRNNTAIYTVDPRGLATGEFDINENVGMQRASDRWQTQDTLRVLAEKPTAAPSSTATICGAAMKQIVSDSSAYYLLGYNSSQAPQDGKFHEIKVRVKRPGVQVRARKGYWALTDGEDGARPARPSRGRRRRSRKALAAIAPMPTAASCARGSARAGDDGKTQSRSCGSRAADAGRARENRGGLADGHRRRRATSSFAAASPADAGARRQRARRSASTRPRQARLADVDRRRRQRHARQRRPRGRGAGPDGADVMLGTPRVYVARTAREFKALTSDPDAAPTAARDSAAPIAW